MENTDNKPLTEDKYTIRAAERCLEVLDVFTKADSSLGVTDICTELSINANMAFRMLTTLANSGYLVRNQKDGRFSLSLKVLQLSRRALLSLEIKKTAMPYMEQLWKEFPKSNINLGVFNQGEVVVVDRIESERLPRTYFTPGKILPFHAAALGKVLVSELSDEYIDELIATHGLKTYTATTINDAQQLKDVLAKVRVEQVAWDHGEHVLNDTCVAAPIRDASRNIIAAMSLSAFDIYMSKEEMQQAGMRVRDITRTISSLMGYNT